MAGGSRLPSVRLRQSRLLAQECAALGMYRVGIKPLKSTKEEPNPKQQYQAQPADA